MAKKPGKAPTKGAEARCAARRVDALKLRQAGFGYRDIAKRTGVSPAQSYADVKHALTELASQEIDEGKKVRALEVSRLDELFVTLWPTAKSGNMFAIDRVLKIIAQRADLYGVGGLRRIQWTPTEPVPGGEAAPAPLIQNSTSVSINVINQQTAAQVNEVAEVAKRHGLLDRLLSLPEVSPSPRIEIEGDHAGNGNGNGHGAGNGSGNGQSS